MNWTLLGRFWRIWLGWIYSLGTFSPLFPPARFLFWVKYWVGPAQKLRRYKQREGNPVYMFYLELVSGLRKDDLVALRWTDLKAERRIMPVSKQVTARNSKVTLSRPNTETSVREVFIPQTVVELLTQEHENHRDNILLLHQKKE